MVNNLKIAILGASDFQNPIILKAKEIGLETHAFAWECGDIGEKTADVFHPISIADKEKILEVCQKEKISGITTCASDFAVVAQNYVAEKMGLPGNPISSTLCCTNKFVMREKLKSAHIPVPVFFKISLEEELPRDIHNISFPAIVKPTDRSGSRAIAKVNNIDELKKAIEEACSISFSHEAIVEEYIEGPEYSCESITWKGTHHTLALTKKYTTGDPHFIETGHIQPSDIPKEIQPKVISQIHQALDALGIKNSASHAEFRLRPDGSVRIIEVGSRMGGDCIGSDLTYLSTGIDFLKATIQVALGEEPDLHPTHPPETAEIRFLMNEKDLNEFQKIKDDKTIIKVSNFNINGLKEVQDSSTRIGYYIKCRKNLLIIGAGIGQINLINKAKERGVHVTVVSPKGNYPGLDIADEVFDCDIYDRDRIISYAKQKSITAVTSDQNDLMMPTVAYVSEKLNLPGNNLDKVWTYCNKNLFRDKCEQLQIPVPKHLSIAKGNEPNTLPFSLPWIIKPEDSQSSKGVSKVDTTNELNSALETAFENSKTKKAIAEEFFTGDEVVCEGFVYHGKYYNLAFADRRYFKLNNMFIPSQTIFPSSLEQNLKNRIIEFEEKISRSIGLNFAIIHSEYIVNKESGEIRIVESAPRGGGVYISSHLIPLCTGMDINSLLLDCVLGQEKDVDNILKSKKDTAAAYICFYLPEGKILNIKGIEELKRLQFVKMVDIRDTNKGDITKPMLHKGMRKGPILICAENRSKLEENISTVRKLLNIEILLSSGKTGNIIWE